MAVDPLVLFGDAAAATVAALSAALTGRSEPYAAGTAVATRVPDGRRRDGAPLVQVAIDSNAVQYPVNARLTVRVTIWHRDPGRAHDLAQLCQALLAVHHGLVLRQLVPLTGPLDATDPASGADLSSFTMRADVRPIVAA